MALRLPLFSGSYWRLKRAFVKQLTPYDCGICCLAMIMRHFKMQPDIQLLRQYSGTNAAGTSMLGLKRCASLTGLQPKAVAFSCPAQLNNELPCILNTIDKTGQAHFVVVFASIPNNTGQDYLIADPAKGIFRCSGDGLAAMCPTRAALIFKRTMPQAATGFSSFKEFRLLAGSMRKSLSIAAIALSAGLLVSALGLSTAFFISRLVDNSSRQSNASALIAGTVLFAAMLVARAALTFLRQKIILILSHSFCLDAAGLFLKDLFSHESSFYRTHENGELLTRLHDTTQAGQTYTIILAILTDIFMLASLIAAMFFFAPAAGWACLAYSLAVILISGSCSGKILRAQGRIAQLFSITGTLLSERLQKVELLQEFGLERYAVRSVMEGLERWQLKARQFAEQMNIFAAGLELLKGCLLITGLLILMQAGLTAGDLAASLTLVFAITPGLMKIWSNTLQLSECRNSLRRIDELLTAKPAAKITGTTVHLRSVERICLRDLSIGYPAKSPLFSGFNAEWKKGQVIALDGRCGSGKSSFLRCLFRYLEPLEGDIIVNDTDIRKCDTRSLRALSGFVPQEVQLAGNGIAENLLMGQKANPAELRAFWKAYGFDNFLNLEEAGPLSAGQGKLLCFARALYKHPKVLLLDEATAGMDPVMEDFVFRTLEKIREDMIIIFATHNADLLKHADEVVNFAHVAADDKNYRYSHYPA